MLRERGARVAPAPRPVGGRTAAVIAGSALASAGWGAVLPYLYADISSARHLGGLTAAGTFTAFALGSLVAAPFAGRWADRRNPVTVAVLARLGLAFAVFALGWAGSAPTVWLAAAATGAAVAVTQPAVQVILLADTPESARRTVFAWQFIATNLALAVGGVAGGFLVDLHSPAGTRPLYEFAAVMAVISAVAVRTAGRAVPRVTSFRGIDVPRAGYGVLLRLPALRWLLVVQVALTLACYAQFDSGLPAFALSALHVEPRMLGIGVAVNAVLVSVLTAPVVAATRRRSPVTLLAACALIWVGCWLVIGLPLVTMGAGAAMLVLGYAGFSAGETMLAPVLNPLAAELAPEGMAGRALSALSGANTAATAIGPAISGVLLAVHVPAAFILLQIGCCAAALGALRPLARSRQRHELALAA